MIGILNLNSGNLRSVANAVYESGFDYLLVDNKNHFDEITHLIIPGVGHYLTAITYLKQTELYTALNEFQQSKRPLLGICLGMQLFATEGNEGGINPGLDFIPGKVQHFKESLQTTIRVPHVGWNTVHFQKPHPIFEGIKNNRDFYFVHSYHYVCQENQHVFGATEYGITFHSIVADQHIIGLQFHPEKSQKNGLALIENFCKWDGLC